MKSLAYGAEEAEDAAQWSGFEELLEFAMEAARFEDGAQMWHVLNALVEVGVPMHLLGSAVVPCIYCHVVEPNSSLGTDRDEDLATALDFIGLPYSYNARGTELILESDGDGWDFKRGQSEAKCTAELPGTGGWRQVPTSTLEEAHLALLACADRYWELMPARLKTPEFVGQSLPGLFKVASVYEIPRRYIRDRAIGVLTGEVVGLMSGVIGKHALPDTSCKPVHRARTV